MKCPYCNKIFTPEMKVCHKRIASGSDKIAKRSGKKAIEEKKELYEKMKRVVSHKINSGKKVTTNTFLNILKIKGKTDGDTIRLILDKLVCEGYIDKIQFNCRKGHTYLVNKILNKCEHCQQGSFIFPVCLASKDKFKNIGEYDGE